MVGPIDTAFQIVQWLGSEFPVLIYHHNHNIRPFDYRPTRQNILENSILTHKDAIPVNLFALRAPYHDSFQDYSTEMGYLLNFMAMLSVSTALVDSLVSIAHERMISPIVVSGISLGGWVTNLHRAYFGSADTYIPMLAGAALEDVFLESTYRVLTGMTTQQNPEKIKQALNFELQFLQAPEPNVFPLLARYDQIVRVQRQRLSYAKHPLAIINKGHITASLATDKLRKHILKHLYGSRGDSKPQIIQRK